MAILLRSSGTGKSTRLPSMRAHAHGRYHRLVARSKVHCLLVDRRDLREEMYELAELNAFYSPAACAVRSPSARPVYDIVIDHPAVEPRHAWLTAASNHRMVRIAGRGDAALPRRAPVRDRSLRHAAVGVR